MNVHKNARLTPRGRERIARQVASGQTPKAVSEAAGVCPRTARKWVDRYRREGLAGLRDRSSRPHRLYRPTPQAIVDEVAVLRRQRCTGKQIAAQVGVSPATVSRILRRLGLNKLSALEPAEPVRRYERERPGEMIHIDIKKLGRIDGIGHRITGDRRGQSNRRSRGEGLGWEFVHVAIDDNSRIAPAKSLVLCTRVAAHRPMPTEIAQYRTTNQNNSCMNLPGKIRAAAPPNGWCATPTSSHILSLSRPRQMPGIAIASKGHSRCGSAAARSGAGSRRRAPCAI